MGQGKKMASANENTKKIENIVVFCGSRFGNHPAYAADARALGALLGQNGFNLVYGGGNAGLMGEVARAARDHGATVTGIITHAFLNAAGYERPAGTNELVVRTLPSRKARMIQQADACIVLAGGIGTQDEQWEAVALIDMNIVSQSKSFVKPVIVLNTNGIYDPLKLQMKKLIAEGFIHPGREKLVRSVDTPAEVIAKLNAWNAEGVMRACDIARRTQSQAATPQPKIG